MERYSGGSALFFAATIILACESMGTPQRNTIWFNVFVMVLVAAIPASFCMVAGKEHSYLTMGVPYAITVAICCIASANAGCKYGRLAHIIQQGIIVVGCLFAIKFYSLHWNEGRDSSWMVNPGMMPTLGVLTVWLVSQSLQSVMQLVSGTSKIPRLVRHLLFAASLSIATALFVLTVFAILRLWLVPRMFAWDYLGDEAIESVEWALNSGAPQFGFRGYVFVAVIHSALKTMFSLLYSSSILAATRGAILVPAIAVAAYNLRFTAGHFQLAAKNAYKTRIKTVFCLISSATFLVMLGACFVGFQIAWEKAEIAVVSLNSSPSAIGVWKVDNEISFENDDGYAYFLSLVEEHGFRRDSAFSISDGGFQIELFGHARKPVLLAYRRASNTGSTLPFRETHWIEIIPIDSQKEAKVFVCEYDTLRSYEPIKKSMKFFHYAYDNLASRVLDENEEVSMENANEHMQVDYQQCYRQYWCKLARMWLEPLRETTLSDGVHFVTPDAAVYRLPIWTGVELAIRQRLKSVFDERIREWFEDTHPESAVDSIIILNEMVDVRERMQILELHPPVAGSAENAKLKFFAWRSESEEFDIKLEGIDRVELLSDPIPTLVLIKSRE